MGTDLPTKLITVDRRVILLPPTDASDPAAAALVVSGAFLSNALVALFESVRARDVPTGSVTHDRIADEDRELLTMLASGLEVEAVPGASTSTYTRSAAASPAWCRP
ncbi:hypothetical protein [Streptomyces sp. NPDC088727]|uniref:hypothetical protein n=1 Tax=Streptomyces sp. NPDC088727 TaxID=3365875 RepID=UPI00382867F9